ncbi:unnamed protein product [Clavelina lepadiformis]|uniref:Translin-associated factor X-interacting protein 1 N-terminal domain-containing protein n=1 Tax=Clavelina lepadiformis TaxID=159417 RepID=A0ABP0GDQ1_CLALP
MSVKLPKIPPIEPQQNRTDNYQDVAIPQAVRTSTSYKLSGINAKHLLPTEESLRPNQDTNSGEIETWPAYASRSVSDTGLIGKSFNKDLMVVKKSVLPKPKFLSALETYVRKEIVQLDCTDPEPSELRLQAYREVFEYLIEDFKTYQPLLSQIKSEYEKMLSHHRQRIRELEPLKAMLITVSEQCDQKILKIREEERQEILVLRKTKMDLLKYIDNMREKENALQAQVAKLQEELAVEYKKYRNECDMRKLLISDMNDLRHQQEDLKRAAGQGIIDADDDPIRLKLALKVAKDDLTRQANELTRIQADYGDVVPRRDFQMLEAKHVELEEKHKQLVSDFQGLKEEHDTLLDVHKQVLEQRDEFYTEAETLRRSATPRPQWSKCGEIVPAGPDHWHETTSGKRSAEILEALLNEFQSGGALGPDSLDGRGTGDDVPKFLRFEGSFKNRKFKKSELSILLKDIWARKVQSDAERGSREKMTDFLHSFFMERYGNHEEMAAEWGYSLFEALNNFKDEPHVNVLWNVVNDEGTEDLHYHQMDTIKNVMVELQNVDDEKTGHISEGLFINAMHSAFPFKSEASKEALVAAALEELEASAENIEYNALFTEDEEGHTGPFLNLLRTQGDEERDTYIEEIVKQLEGMEQVPVNELRSTLMMIDPVINQAQIVNYLQIAYKCTSPELQDAEPCDNKIIQERMKNGGVHRVGAVY